MKERIDDIIDKRPGKMNEVVEVPHTGNVKPPLSRPIPHKHVYNLELHESVEVTGSYTNGEGVLCKSFYLVTRVPGGWIYADNRLGQSSSTFVPYDNSFM